MDGDMSFRVNHVNSARRPEAAAAKASRGGGRIALILLTLHGSAGALDDAAPFGTVANHPLTLEAAPSTTGEVAPEAAKTGANPSQVQPAWELPARELAPIGPPSDPTAMGSTNGAATPQGGLANALDPRRSGTLRVIAATGGVILTVIVSLKLLQRFLMGGLARAPGGPSGILQVLARYPIARGQQLILLSLGRRILLLHQSGASMSTLAEISEDAEAASLRTHLEAADREIQGQGFSALLRGLSGAFHSATEASAHDLAPETVDGVETIDLTRPRNTSRRGRRWLRLRGGLR
jgi:hypothetical protein